jgi:hypothetical protein
LRADCREISQFTSPFGAFGFREFDIASDFEIRISDFVLPKAPQRRARPLSAKGGLKH